jgi:ferredoxin-NADP reductase
MIKSVRILMIEFETHDVRKFIVEKPDGFEYSSGQYILLGLDEKGAKKPFTIASSPSDKVLEFFIKIYPEREGFTHEMSEKKVGDSFVISNPRGGFDYKGRGVFLAAGTGITPFLGAIRSQDMKGCKFIFTNKSKDDVLLEKELKHVFNEDLHLVYSQKDGRITKDYLSEKIDDFSQYFYVCGPRPFMSAMKGYLVELGAEESKIIF